MIKAEDVGEELCDYCPCTEYGAHKINTNPMNLCEGCSCDVALEYYLECKEENKEE